MKLMVQHIHMTTDPLEYITFELQYLGYCSIQLEDCHYYGVEEFKLNYVGKPNILLKRYMSYMPSD